MRKAALSVMIIAVLSKILGFGREVVLSYTHGASSITDIYLISQTIPVVLFGFVSAGIAISYIPTYSRILKQRGRSSANRYTSNLSNALLLLASAIIALVLLFTEPLVKIFASGFSGNTLEAAVIFTRISVVGVYFTALLKVFASYLRLNGIYIIPALVGFPMNLIIIASLLISTKTSIYVIVIGSLFGTASQLFLLIPFARKAGFRWQPILDLKDKYMKLMVSMAIPVILGQSVNQINILVDRTLASSIAIGGISTLNYANRLTGFIQGLFVDSITTVMYPMISEMAAENNLEGLKTYVSEAISIINLLVVPATVGAMVFSKQIVALLFGRGAFSIEAINMTSMALFYYSMGMVAYGLREILSRAFYALQDTKTPVINASIAVILNIILNLVFSKYMGIGGLALATSISGIVSAFLMFITLRRKIGSFGLRKTGISFIKISIASVLMGLIASWGFHSLGSSLNPNIAAIVGIGLAMLVYVVLISFMKVPEVERTFEAVKQKLRKRSTRETNE